MKADRKLKPKNAHSWYYLATIKHVVDTLHTLIFTPTEELVDQAIELIIYI